MNNKDLVCYERFDDDKDDVVVDSVAHKKVCRPSSPVWHLKEQHPTLLQLWGEEDTPPVTPVTSHSCWKCGEKGATKPIVSTATGDTFYIHKQLRGYPGQCDVFSK